MGGKKGTIYRQKSPSVAPMPPFVKARPTSTVRTGHLNVEIAGTRPLSDAKSFVSRQYHRP